MAKDMIHEQVKRALIKDGWTITADPLFLQYGGVDIYVDLGAEKIIGAEKGDRKIAVEIKSFIRASLISEFHTALGQFLNYRVALKIKEPERILYLAIPEDVYNTFFTLPFTQTVVEEYRLKLIICNLETEAITTWKN